MNDEADQIRNLAMAVESLARASEATAGHDPATGDRFRQEARELTAAIKDLRVSSPARAVAIRRLAGQAMRHPGAEAKQWYLEQIWDYAGGGSYPEHTPGIMPDIDRAAP